MRRLAYFYRNYLDGLTAEFAWRKAAEDVNEDRPRPIDYSMGWDEFDDWPYTQRRRYDRSHRKTIWQILTRPTPHPD